MAIKKVEFKYIPEAKSTVHTLGSLVFDRRNEMGPKAYINLTNEDEYVLLTRDFIAAIYEYVKPCRISSQHSISGYAVMIRRILSYCRSIHVPPDFRMKDISLEFLLEYRSYIKLTLSNHKSEKRRRQFGDLNRLLIAGQEIGLANSEFSPPRNFRYINDSDVTQPYTAGEALDFEDACRTHIRSLLARIEKGNDLIKEGVNPRKVKPDINPITGKFYIRVDSERPWNKLQNLLWYVVNVMNGKYLNRQELLAQGHSSFNSSLMGTWGGIYRKTDVYSLLYPLAQDLIPYIILLAKKTGRNESSILNLRRDCLQEIDGRYYMWYEKDRGSARRYKKAIDNDGQFSPVELIRSLWQLTEPLVRHAVPTLQDKLFLGLTVKGHGSNAVKDLDPSYVKYQMNHKDGWCDQYCLVDEHDRPLRVSLRRWRVYYLSNKYRKHGQLSKISRDAAHTLAKTSVGYLANASTKHIHIQAVQVGIQNARNLSRPVVMVNDSLADITLSLGCDTKKGLKILRGENDVFFAACKDIYNRPGGQVNTPCDKPWMCFVCSNSIITRHVLPRVLAFKKFMLEEHSVLSHDNWVEKFGDVWNILTTNILPKFSQETIDEAERSVLNEKFYIPLKWKV